MAMAANSWKSNRWIWASLQWLVLSFCVITMVTYIASIPQYYTSMVTTCILHGCGTSVPALTMPAQGLTLENYALLLVLIDCAFTFVYYVTSAVMLWKGFREPMGLLAAAAMVAFGTTFPSLAIVASEGHFLAQQWFMLVSMLGWISLSLFFFLFPDGRFVPKWTRSVFLIILAVDVLQFLYRGQVWSRFDVPEYISLLWYIGSTMILIYSQVYRFRKVSRPTQRQQTKWVVYGVLIGFAGFVGMSILFDPAFNDGSAVAFVYLNAILNLLLTAIPITLMLAILRTRLWNIDPLVNRTLVYAALSVCVILLYSIIVLYLSQVFQTRDNFLVSLLATAMVAVVFAPLKEWLQRQINRLMNGRHDDPYSVLLELGNQLIRPLAPEAMLDAVVRTVKDALRLPYTGISIGVGGQQKMVAAAGEPVNEVHSFPVIHRGEEIGTLYVSSRSPGEAFTPEDGKFLDVLLRQAGPIVENVNMTLGMKLLAKDLQESREKLVLAREEERRQIRNNLHDDLAPRLAALALNAATAQKYVEKDPEAAVDMLTDLRQVIRSTVSEIRTLVHDLRPPTLDELGLTGAIEERIRELSKPAELLAAEQGNEPLRIRLHAPLPLPELPAAVEVAAFRIVVESVVNVIKHAGATSCMVRLDLPSAYKLTVEITDDGNADGIWTAASVSGKGGIGQQSIRERAAELGGYCTIERLEHGGTRVFAVFPL